MLTLTVVYDSESCKRCSTRALSSHVTLAELLAWAQENCQDGERVSELSFTIEGPTPLPEQPVPLNHIETKRLSHRLFH